MDPLTQGVLGAVASQQLAKPKHIFSISLLGFLSGMAPDLDVLINSSVDPLLSLEYHRHFTHSLFFIPFGGLLCALFFFFVFARRVGLTFGQTYLYCVAGYATHGLLDACTSYGTQLLWPLSNARIAWNTISIIDPLFTVPLLILISVAVVKRSRRVSVLALSWVILYALLGIVQRDRAEAFGWELAQQRGHRPERVDVKPSLGNLLLWKIVYADNEIFYVDAVRVGLASTFYQGDSIARLNIEKDFPWLSTDSQQAKDIERFRWFSDDYLAVSPVYPERIIDMRYSLLPNDIRGLWGIELNPDANSDEYTRFVSDRKRDANTSSQLWNMIMGVSTH